MFKKHDAVIYQKTGEDGVIISRNSIITHVNNQQIQENIYLVRIFPNKRRDWFSEAELIKSSNTQLTIDAKRNEQIQLAKEYKLKIDRIRTKLDRHVKDSVLKQTLIRNIEDASSILSNPEALF